MIKLKMVGIRLCGCWKGEGGRKIREELCFVDALNGIGRVVESWVR